MCLDTVPTMIARHLYADFGFEEIEPYRKYLISGAIFFQLKL